MKLIGQNILLLASIVLVLFAYQVQNAKTPETSSFLEAGTEMELGSKCVRLYQHAHYRGRARDICSNTSNVGNFNDIASSLKLGSQVKSVACYLHSNYRGAKVTYTSNINWTGGKFPGSNTWINDNISSVIVTFKEDKPSANCINIYQHYYYKGSVYRMCNDKPSIGHFKSIASGVKIGPKIKRVELYQYTNYRGAKKVYTSNSNGFRGNYPGTRVSLNDHVQSIKIITHAEYAAEQRKVAAERKRKQEAAKKRQAEAKRKAIAERKKIEAEKKRKAEAKRKAAAEKKRKAEAERKIKAAAERKRKAEAERKRKAAAEKKRKEKERRETPNPKTEDC